MIMDSITRTSKCMLPITKFSMNAWLKVIIFFSILIYPICFPSPRMSILVLMENPFAGVGWLKHPPMSVPRWTLSDMKTSFGEGVWPTQSIRCPDVPVWERKHKMWKKLARFIRNNFSSFSVCLFCVWEYFS